MILKAKLEDGTSVAIKMTTDEFIELDKAGALSLSSENENKSLSSENEDKNERLILCRTDTDRYTGSKEGYIRAWLTDRDIPFREETLEYSGTKYLVYRLTFDQLYELTTTLTKINALHKLGILI